ncbi:hypothetical protein C3747_515g1 [Trypanosoma cruzi]|uniref:Uncharacterized protein n=1 Tax=Trypanosoma cruzi TaxID=5693 RepID=A0A2V2UUF0_TRYCR|nr:hypothetical protein C3747_515g1 [Trypanosoma cruzi]
MRVKKVEMVRRRDAVIADLCLFCLDGPDCGTAFELGHAAALGMTVPTFTFDWRSMREKYGAACDASVMSVEDFGLSFSLMLCDGAEAFYSFDAALHRFLRHSSECRGCDCGDVREVRVNALGPGGIFVHGLACIPDAMAGGYSMPCFSATGQATGSVRHS